LKKFRRDARAVPCRIDYSNFTASKEKVNIFFTGVATDRHPVNGCGTRYHLLCFEALFREPLRDRAGNSVGHMDMRERCVHDLRKIDGPAVETRHCLGSTGIFYKTLSNGRCQMLLLNVQRSSSGLLKGFLGSRSAAPGGVTPPGAPPPHPPRPGGRPRR